MTMFARRKSAAQIRADRDAPKTTRTRREPTRSLRSIYSTRFWWSNFQETSPFFQRAIGAQLLFG